MKNKKIYIFANVDIMIANKNILKMNIYKN